MNNRDILTILLVISLLITFLAPETFCLVAMVLFYR